MMRRHCPLLTSLVDLPQPIFWAFLTVETLLQSTRFMFVKSPPSLPSILSNLLPLAPPHISRLVILGSRYLTSFNQIWKDGCLLLWLIGMTALIGPLVA